MGSTLPDGVDDNILSEILLRLPPQPSSLPRASAVCKRWHGIACDPGFRRRFRRHHRRNAPLLGFFDPVGFVPTLDAPDLLPPGRLPLLADDPGRYYSCGSRHGLVFILDWGGHILVWDPATGDQYRIALPPDFEGGAFLPTASGAVLRDAAGGAGDDVHFRVVLRGGDLDAQHRRVLACVYSSETNSWGDLISLPVPPDACMIPLDPAVLVGDSLYWQIRRANFTGILEFNLERQKLDVIQAPCHMSHRLVSVIRGEDGGLGFLSLLGFTAQLWERKTADSDGVASWVLRTTIQLDKLLSLDPDEHVEILVLGYAEENNYVFLRTAISLFLLQLQSLQFKDLVLEDYDACHPFESVFTAAMGAQEQLQVRRSARNTRDLEEEEEEEEFESEEEDVLEEEDEIEYEDDDEY